jgi:hypothetical protein
VNRREHYEEAERLLDAAEVAEYLRPDDLKGWDGEQLLTLAQIHATLAVARVRDYDDAAAEGL